MARGRPNKETPVIKRGAYTPSYAFYSVSRFTARTNILVEMKQRIVLIICRYSLYQRRADFAPVARYHARTGHRQCPTTIARRSGWRRCGSGVSAWRAARGGRTVINRISASEQLGRWLIGSPEQTAVASQRCWHAHCDRGLLFTPFYRRARGREADFHPASVPRPFGSTNAPNGRSVTWRAGTNGVGAAIITQRKLAGHILLTRQNTARHREVLLWTETS